MKVLAVIVTRRRPDWLTRCIQSLLDAAQTEPGLQLQIKVGVNGTDPETLNALERMTGSLSSQRLLKFEQLGDGLTPGDARNRLLENENTDWVYFIDDDAFVDSHLFTKFRDAAMKHPDTSVIGGPNLTPSGSPCFQTHLGAALSSRFATFKTVDRYLAFGQARACGEEALILCNLFIRQNVLPSHPFPTDLRCGEENHLLRKLSAQGVRMIHSPELSVSHERRGSLPHLISQVIHYGISRGQSMVFDPRARHWAYALPSLCVLTALLLAAKWLMGLGPSPTLVTLVVLYLILGLCAAFRARKPGTSTFLIAALFFWIHASYGIGVIAGAVRALRREARS